MAFFCICFECKQSENCIHYVSTTTSWKCLAKRKCCSSMTGTDPHKAIKAFRTLIHWQIWIGTYLQGFSQSNSGDCDVRVDASAWNHEQPEQLTPFARWARDAPPTLPRTLSSAPRDSSAGEQGPHVPLPASLFASVSALEQRRQLPRVPHTNARLTWACLGFGQRIIVTQDGGRRWCQPVLLLSKGTFGSYLYSRLSLIWCRWVGNRGFWLDL